MRRILIIMMALLPLESFAPTIPMDKRVARFEANSLQFLPFTEERLVTYLTYKNVNFKEVVLAQAHLETGNFSSRIFIEGNNLFGMKKPYVRSTTAIGTHLGHARYSHWTKSVDDYLLWYEYHQKYLKECYYTFLVNVGYAEDVEYTNKLKMIG